MVPAVLDHAGGTILIVATNPVDIMTFLATRYAVQHGLSPSRVFGTGTMLDTARFRTLLGERLGVDSQHVHGYVIGEHGDSEVLAWSLVTVSALHLEDYASRMGVDMGVSVRGDVEKRVKNAAYAIIHGKGATYYGIGSALARLVEVILHDQRSIVTVSAVYPDRKNMPGIAFSMPHLIGGDGILSTIPIELGEEEDNRLQESVGVIRNAVQGLDDSMGEEGRNSL